MSWQNNLLVLSVTIIIINIKKSSFHLLRFHLCYYFSSYLGLLTHKKNEQKFKGFNDGLKMIYKSWCIYVCISSSICNYPCGFLIFLRAAPSDHMLIHVSFAFLLSYSLLCERTHTHTLAKRSY